MTKNSKSKFYFLIALLFLALLSTACNDNTVTPTADVITGEETLDTIITDTQSAVENTVSTACKLCLFAESAENCTGVCNEEIE